MDDAAYWRVTPAGVEVAVLVVPGASRSEIVGVHGDRLRVRVAAPPERGRANDELLRLLRERTGLDVELVRGGRARRKTVVFPTVEARSVIAALGV